MKYLLSMAALLILVSTSAIADEPPSWSEFEVYSSNRLYFAKVTIMDRNRKSERWDWKYKLTVYEKEGSTNSELWSCSYLYDGCTGGLLSDDGTTFVYVSFWYYEKSPAVTIYQTGELKKQIIGREFNVDRSKLQRTVSHQLWLNPSRNYRLIRTKEVPLGLEINTIDLQRIIVDLRSFKISRS